MFIGYWVHKPKPGPGLCPVNPCALAKRLKIFCCVQRNMPIGGQAIEQTLIFRICLPQRVGAHRADAKTSVELTVNRRQARVRYLGLDFSHL